MSYGGWIEINYEITRWEVKHRERVMKQRLIGIVVGSRSDLEVVKEASTLLDRFGIDYELVVSSAHRNPEGTKEYARGAGSRGLKLIIAAAGLSAALPGVIASYTTLPVIGLPISAGPLAGLDSLCSMVQMPTGVPVATVGINNAKNAAILAAEILALSDETLRERLEEYRKELAEK